MKVLSISPPKSSTSTVEILSGHGACPPEDDANMFTWSDEVSTLRTGSYAAKQKVLQKISEALNYKVVLPVSEIYLAGGGRGTNANGSGTGGRGRGEEVIIPLTSFDPDRFDIEEARKRVKDALGSPDSVHSGPKTFVHPLRYDLELYLDLDEDDEDRERVGEGVPVVRGVPGTTDPKGLKKGQRLERTYGLDRDDGDEEDGREDRDGDAEGVMGRIPRSYMQEVTSEKRDKIVGGCCWSCGSPHGLQSCVILCLMSLVPSTLLLHSL